MRRALAVLAILSAATACGGNGDSPSDGSTRLPDCAKAKEVALPQQFPKGFPLPPGTVVTFGRFEEPGQIFIAAASPGSFENARDFLRRELEKAGYRLGRGDEEEGEAEAPFTGNGYRGSWRVNKIRDCDGAATVRVILIRQP